jgi:hypothetical protein
MGTEARHNFKLIGGPCDGETTRQEAEWDGRAHRPPPWIRVQPQEPLTLRITEEVNEAKPCTSVIYHRWVWQSGNQRWFEYRFEKPKGY